MIKIWQFQLYLLNCWSSCYQTWFDNTLSLVRVSYGEIGLLYSRSRSQQNFKMSLNVCPDNIFLTVAPLTTKLGVVMHHHEPDCLSKRLVWCLQSKGHREGSYNQNGTFKYIFWTADIFATKLCLMAHHHKLDCLVKQRDCSVVFNVTVTGNVLNSSECSSGRYVFNCWTFCNHTWYDDASSWARVPGRRLI